MFNSIHQLTNWDNIKNALGNESCTERSHALVSVKDTIIGSNREKGAFIACGLVPVILQITENDKNSNLEDKLNALVILGSLAKGSPAQVQSLVKDYNILPVLMKEIFKEDNNKKCVEICLSTIQSVYESPECAADRFFTDVCSLSYFLGLSSPENSLKTQICVMNIIVSLCKSYEDQIRLLHAGTVQILARIISYDNSHIQISGLRCLASMCYLNRAVTDNVCVTSFHGRSLPDVLTDLLSRLAMHDIQLTASKCLTYIYRSGTLLPTDHRILNKTLPTLIRLCADHFEIATRTAASETLGFLIEVDPDLQRTAAISNTLFKSLYQLLQGSDHVAKYVALSCFASLGANDEPIRRRIIENSGLIDSILDGLSDTNVKVILASVRSLHSLSRSVQQLRTTFQDHKIWEPLLYIITHQTSNDLLIATTSIFCNLLLEFSPSKQPMISSGIIEKLCGFTENADPSLRLNSIWALMNMAFQSSQQVKTDIINTLGTTKILSLLRDPDPAIILKTLGLLRNLLSQSSQIDFIMTVHAADVLEAINKLLDANYSSDIKEQVLCIVGNIAAEAEHNDYITQDKKIMIRLGEYLIHSDERLKSGALFAINNIVYRKDSLTKDKYFLLDELGILRSVRDLNQKTAQNKMPWEDYIQKTLREIVMQCNRFCPEMLN